MSKQDKTKKLQKGIEIRDKALISQTLQATPFLRSMAIVPEIVAAGIADNFAVEERDGKVQVVVNEDSKGAWSTMNPGEKATVEEAAQILAESKCKPMLMPPGAERPLEENNEDADNNGSDLLTQYQATKENGDTLGMVALKNQMAQKGIKAPL